MTLDYTLMLPLKHRALIKIAIALFNQDDIRELISEFPFILNLNPGDDKGICTERAKKGLKKIRDEVLKNIIKLPLPESLKHELLGVVEAIGWQLLKCREYYQCKEFFKKNFTKFYWTPQGTIDKKKSAELYVEDRSINVVMRYEFACRHCLEDYIPVLYQRWKRHKGYKNLKAIRAHESPFVSFWSHYTEKKWSRLSKTVETYRENNGVTFYITVFEYMFLVSAQAANETAIKYFSKLLEYQERERLCYHVTMFLSEMHSFPENDFDWECHADAFCFLFPKLRESTKQLVAYDQASILRCFLIWPWQNSFIELAKSVFCCLSQVDPVTNPQIQYYNVLKLIASKILYDSNDYNYRNLFVEFWHLSHDTYKEYVIDNYASDSLLSAVIKIEDKENINFVLKYVTTSRKRKNSFCN